MIKYSILFEDEDKLLELLEELQPIFNEIETIENMFKADEFLSLEDYAKYLNKLTGYYMFLERIYSLAKSYEDIKEASAFLEAKNNSVDKKISDEVAKSISKVKNVNYIKTKNILESYIRLVEKAIITIQSQLNRIYEEKKYKTI